MSRCRTATLLQLSVPAAASARSAVHIGQATALRRGRTRKMEPARQREASPRSRPSNRRRLKWRKASGDPTVSQEDIDQEKNQIKAAADFRSSIFATGTLGALKFVVTGMSELPGRKSVILFSDGFRLLSAIRRGLPMRAALWNFCGSLWILRTGHRWSFTRSTRRGLQTTGITAADDISIRRRKR